MSKLDESGIIRVFQKNLGIKTAFEDVEFFSIGDKKIVVKTDTLVQSTDIPAKMAIRDAARKSVVGCVSDFVAKGIRPRYGTISLNLPKGISRHSIDQIALGFRQASQEFDLKILGGDTNEGKEFVFQVCLFGTARKIVPRRGAQPGDLIFTSGPFGYAAAGLEILEMKRKTNPEFKREALKSFTRPTPRLNFALKNKRYFTSSMDSSDGLSTTLNEMARQSQCKFLINRIPTTVDLEKFSKINEIDADRLVFHGGEEYEFVFTVEKKHKTAIQKNALLTRTPVFEIGHVLKGTGVFVKSGSSVESLPDLGWHHF